MRGNNKAIAGIFLTLIMVVSIAVFPDSDWGVKIDENDENDKIDYSLIEDLQAYAIPNEPSDGNCWKVVVVPVTWSDFSALGLTHRYSTPELSN